MSAFVEALNEFFEEVGHGQLGCGILKGGRRTRRQRFGNPVEDAVHELARLDVTEIAGDLDGLIDDDGRGTSVCSSS